MRTLVEDLRAKASVSEQGGGAAVRDRHVSRGKLLPRDRGAQLLDSGTPFLEIGQLDAHGMYDGDAPCAGVIAGIGRIEGTDYVGAANDATVTGGTYYPMTVKKHLRGAGDREAEGPAVRLTRRFRRRVPAQAGRNVPRPRALRRIFYNGRTWESQSLAAATEASWTLQKSTPRPFTSHASTK